MEAAVVTLCSVIRNALTNDGVTIRVVPPMILCSLTGSLHTVILPEDCSVKQCALVQRHSPALFRQPLTPPHPPLPTPPVKLPCTNQRQCYAMWTAPCDSSLYVTPSETKAEEKGEQLFTQPCQRHKQKTSAQRPFSQIITGLGDAIYFGIVRGAVEPLTEFYVTDQASSLSALEPHSALRLGVSRRGAKQQGGGAVAEYCPLRANLSSAQLCKMAAVHGSEGLPAFVN
ncbi:hypothetical protein JZ751_028858 [Albula glossodonta]|uniref:Uncharacterized protein n=1 Tax=Albula glossodonta TaxID=121402 RepID=A0A8T2NDC1_9TELE|nr:hypothetical protein JZ751_028858 [Albula glossodonta]